MNQLVYFSGGATGADALWDHYAHQFLIEDNDQGVFHIAIEGMANIRHNLTIDVKSANAIDEDLTKINDALIGRTYPPSQGFSKKLLQRNYFIALFSSVVYAVGWLEDDQIAGGTTWTCNIAAWMEKPVRFFDQHSGKWYKYAVNEGDKLTELENIPILKNRSGLIGSRKLNEHGSLAIQEVCENTRLYYEGY